MAFKIYKKNNYLIIEDTVENKQYQGLAKNVFIYKDQKLENTYDFSGLDDTGLNGVSVLEMIDSLNVPFTISTFEAFYTLETGSAGSGAGGGAGDASAANQVTGNNTLTAINNKTSAQFASSTGILAGATQTVSLALTDESAGSVRISGTWAGTITFEGTLDGTTWDSINAVSASTSNPQITTTVNGLYRLTPASFSAFRVNMTAFTSGSATITMRATKGVGGIFTNQILPIRIDQTADGITNKIALGQVVFQYSANETGNSTIVQLASGATFTGVIEAIPNQPAFSVLLFSDQNANLIVRQFIDIAGIQKVYEKIYPYTANSQLAISAAANGNFFQAVVQNTGGATTTKLNLNTAYGVIDSATPLNNKPHALYEINGAVVDSNIGNASAGSQRVVLANEQMQDLYLTGQSAQTAIINNIIPTTAGANGSDVTGFSSGSIQIVSTGTGGTFIFEGTNDTVASANFQPIPLFNSSVQNTTPILSAITASVSAILYVFPVTYRYIRVRIVTAITGGTIQAFTTIKRANFTTASIQVTQATASNFNATIGGGTLPTVTNLTTLQNGQTSHSSSATGNPLRIGGRVLPITPDLTLVSGDASDVGITTAQQALTKDFSPSELDYAFAGSINNSTTPNVFKNAAGASLRNYVTNVILNSDALTSAAEVVIKDGLITSNSATANVFTSSFAHDYKIGDQVVFTGVGAYTGIVVGTIYYVSSVPSTTTYTLSATPNSTIITIGGTGSATSNRILFRTKLQTASFGPTGFYLPSPLRGAPNATLDFQTVTATTVGVVYYNISGYVGF